MKQNLVPEFIAITEMTKKTVFFYSLRPQTAIFVVSLHTALKWLIYFNFIFFGISLKFEVDDLLETKLY